MKKKTIIILISLLVIVCIFFIFNNVNIDSYLNNTIDHFNKKEYKIKVNMNTNINGINNDVKYIEKRNNNLYRLETSISDNILITYIEEDNNEYIYYIDNEKVKKNKLEKDFNLDFKKLFKSIKKVKNNNKNSYRLYVKENDLLMFLYNKGNNSDKIVKCIITMKDDVVYSIKFDLINDDGSVTKTKIIIDFGLQKIKLPKSA